MRTSQHLAPTGRSALRGARRPRECPAYRLPQVRELPLRLEPVAPDTFGGLVGSSGAAQLPAVLTIHGGGTTP